jgi:hypothetical protein
MEYEPTNFTVVPNTKFFDRLKNKKIDVGVWVAICIHADKEGKCYPGYKRIRQVTGIGSNSTVKKSIENLVEAGFLSVTSGKKKRNSNQYQMRYLDLSDSTPGDHDSTPSVKSDSTPSVEELYPTNYKNNYKLMFMKLKKINPHGSSLWWNQRPQKVAAEELFKIRENNEQKFDWLVDLVASKQGVEFFPQISSPHQFLSKLQSVIAYCKRNNIDYKKEKSQDSDLTEAARKLGFEMDS